MMLIPFGLYQIAQPQTSGDTSPMAAPNLPGHWAAGISNTLGSSARLCSIKRKNGVLSIFPQEGIRSVEHVEPEKMSEKVSEYSSGLTEGISLPKPVSRDCRR